MSDGDLPPELWAWMKARVAHHLDERPLLYAIALSLPTCVLEGPLDRCADYRREQGVAEPRRQPPPVDWPPWAVVALKAASYSREALEPGAMRLRVARQVAATAPGEVGAYWASKRRPGDPPP